MDAKAVRFDLTCTKCGEKFSIMSSTGPSNVCDGCVLPMLEAVWGMKLQWSKVFGIVEPVAGSSTG